MIRACHSIGYQMAMPVPFAYYHLMNTILLFNVVLLATVPALYRSYATVVPFAVALLIYMGLRDVSTSLADPFGEDQLDFPIPKFLDHTFDRTVSLLEAFQSEEVYARITRGVDNVEEFNDKELKRGLSAAALYDTEQATKEGFFSWTRQPALQMVPPEVDAANWLGTSLVGKVKKGHEPKVVKKVQKHSDPAEEARLEKKCETLKRAGEDLRLELRDQQHEFLKLSLMAVEEQEAEAAQHSI